MRLRPLALAAAFLALATSSRAAARTLLVPGDFAEIQSAIDAAVDGDVVLVGPGRCVGPIEVRDKQVAVRSAAGPVETVLRGADEHAAFVLGNGGELSGFTVTNRNRSSTAAILCFGRGPVVRGNVFAGDPNDPMRIAHGIACGNTDVLVEGNLFRGSTCFQSPLVSVGGDGSESARVVNNLFIDYHCQAVEIANHALVVANNTFLRNRIGLGGTYPGRG